MVKGLENFKFHFRDYPNSYVLIGGAAADIWLHEAGLAFRATKDLDIILVIEALDDKFIRHFWQFIQEGGYQTKQKSSGKPVVYRFISPSKENFPVQLELFSRKPEIQGQFYNAHLAPMPLEEELSSLSVILMNEEYYKFVTENVQIIEDLSLATTKSLICLKARAFLDIRERLNQGKWSGKDERSRLKNDLKKHKNDVIRIALLLSADDKVKPADQIKQDMRQFIALLKADPPDYKQLGKNFGIGRIEPAQILDQIKFTFSL